MPDCIRIDLDVLRPAPISIEVNGLPVACHPGETVATALLAAGVVIFRRTPAGAPRAPVCNMGVCFDCIVTIDGRPGVRSCMTRVAPHMRVEVPHHD